MLLNQCLAISLSPISSGCSYNSSEFFGNVSRFASEEEVRGDEKPSNHQEGKQSSALKLFKQLVDRNCQVVPEVENWVLQNEATQAVGNHQENNRRMFLSHSLRRIEFAGFVVPSWLLLSGSYDDLHCIKSNWLNGSLNSPVGYKIETIGNIRSVNVDYFGSLDDHEANAIAAAKREDDKKLLAANGTPRKAEKSSRQREIELQQQDKHQNPIKFASLEGAILELLNQEENKLRPIHVSELIDCLKRKYSSSISLPSTDYIDCAINGLVRSGRLLLQPMTQSQMRNSLRPHQRLANQSVFVDQFIVLERRADCLEINSFTGQESSSSISSSSSSAPASYLKERRISRVSRNTNNSSSICTTSSLNKSTTLDSGIQSSCETERPFKLVELPAEGAQWQAAKMATIWQPALAEKPNERVRSFSLNRSPASKAVATAADANEPPEAGREFPRFRPSILEARNSGKQLEASNGENQSEVELHFLPKQRSSKMSNLSSLFRSKSMRVISSGNKARNQEHFQQQGRHRISNVWPTKSPGNERFEFQRHTSTASFHGKGQSSASKTIDYLATAQPHKRSFSIRRNSLLTFKNHYQHNSNSNNNSNNNHHHHHSSSNCDFKSTGGSGSGKIVLFLRRLFNLRRFKSGPNHQEVPIIERELTIEQEFIGLPLTNERQLAAGSELLRDGRNEDRDESRENPSLNCDRLPINDFESEQKLLLKECANSTKLAVSASPSSSGSATESGSSSLIEILDCSSIVNSSKRYLREEEVEFKRKNSNRATWSLIKRSNSSLSHNSLDSSSSTVSQQLRKHLDEAYRRHRNCSNQKEKEFIDSINVLRQASRHALQPTNSSSSRASRLSSSNCSSNKSPTNQLAKLNQLEGGTRATGRDFNSNLNQHLAGLPAEPPASCQCKATEFVHYPLLPQRQIDLSSNDNNNHHYHDKQVATKIDQELQANGFSASNKDEYQSQPINQWFYESQRSTGSCCICSSYLSAAAAAQLYPVGCCPISTPCCQFADPAAGRRLGDQSGPPSAGQLSDLCCPLWRSMVANYYQPSGYQLVKPILSPHQHQMVNNNNNFSSGSLGEIAGSKPTQLDNQYSSLQQQQQQQQQQQHQHNTTIDLKIEIGADFGKQLMRGSQRRKLVDRRSRQPLNERQQGLQPQQQQAGDDSLDCSSAEASNTTATEEEESEENSLIRVESLSGSLAEKYPGFIEPDSCEPVSSATENEAPEEVLVYQ